MISLLYSLIDHPRFRVASVHFVFDFNKSIDSLQKVEIWWILDTLAVETVFR